VNVSSPDREEFYPPPELKNVIAATENLRTELTIGWVGKKTTFSYRRIMENLETMRESLLQHYKEYYTMERAFMEASSNRLTEKQRAILRWLSEKYEEKNVYTVLIERLSLELGVPRSTVRWNLRGLREAGLIIAGDRENKGIPVGLTGMGRVLADYLCV
jgi:DNA-binding transcriptional ArsR family regulator